MADEKPKAKSLKLKEKSKESAGGELLMSAVKRPVSDKGTPDKGTPVRTSSFGKSLVKVGKELSKSNGKDGKVSDVKKAVKEEVRSPIKRTPVKEEAPSPIKKASVKVESKGKEIANGKEQGKSASKDVGKVNGSKSIVAKASNGKSSGGDKEKGKSSSAKSPLSKTPVKQEVVSKSSPYKASKSTSVVQAVKKKVMKSTTTTVATTKTVTETKKEKKVYELPGQKHDPPEERDPLRVFYSTLREQLPESEMAEVWMMEYGLLPADEAQAAFDRKQKRAQASKGPGGKTSTPSKASTPSRLSNGSPGVKKSTPVSNGKSKVTGSGRKKRASSSEGDSDDDFLQNLVPKKNNKKLKT